MLGFGKLEWTFVSLLCLLVLAAGGFFLFIVAQLFRSHPRLEESRRPTR